MYLICWPHTHPTTRSFSECSQSTQLASLPYRPLYVSTLRIAPLRFLVKPPEGWAGGAMCARAFGAAVGSISRCLRIPALPSLPLPSGSPPNPTTCSLSLPPPRSLSLFPYLQHATLLTPSTARSAKIAGGARCPAWCHRHLSARAFVSNSSANPFSPLPAPSAPRRQTGHSEPRTALPPRGRFTRSAGLTGCLVGPARQRPGQSPA